MVVAGKQGVANITMGGELKTQEKYNRIMSKVRTKSGVAKGSICRGCGVYIEWIKTENVKEMPIDPALITIITEKGKTVRGYIPHWATCPKANEFRKK